MTQLTWRDRWGGCLVRWGFRRMNYAVAPGLYAVGRPDGTAPVFVSANYKLSFDILRSALKGINGFILVLDTKGINVWCAAGKGTFGAEELVRRVRELGLEKVVSHRKLILPQLSATGVNAFEAARRSGFRVLFGPVYARDIPRFLAAGWAASLEWRRIRFRWHERLAVAPVELVQHGGRILLTGLVIALLAGASPGGFYFSLVWTCGGAAFALWVLSFILAGFLGPLLLPWLPGRAFSVKGACLGAAIAVIGPRIADMGWTVPRLLAWLFLVASGASFMLLNFTGATTFTSVSGVKREVRFALPALAVVGILGLIAWTAAGMKPSW